MALQPGETKQRRKSPKRSSMALSIPCIPLGSFWVLDFAAFVDTHHCLALPVFTHFSRPMHLLDPFGKTESAPSG